MFLTVLKDAKDLPGIPGIAFVEQVADIRIKLNLARVQLGEFLDTASTTNEEYGKLIEQLEFLQTSIARAPSLAPPRWRAAIGADLSVLESALRELKASKGEAREQKRKAAKSSRGEIGAAKQRLASLRLGS